MPEELDMVLCNRKTNCDPLTPDFPSAYNLIAKGHQLSLDSTVYSGLKECTQIPHIKVWSLLKIYRLMNQQGHFSFQSSQAGSAFMMML